LKKQESIQRVQTPAKAVHILLVNYHYVAESSYCVKFYRNRLTHFGWANRGSFSFCFTYKHSNKQILSPRLQVTNMDRTEWINAHNTWFQAQVCFLRSWWWPITFLGWVQVPQKPKFLGAN